MSTKIIGRVLFLWEIAMPGATIVAGAYLIFLSFGSESQILLPMFRGLAIALILLVLTVGSSTVYLRKQIELVKKLPASGVTLYPSTQEAPKVRQYIEEAKDEIVIVDQTLHALPNDVGDLLLGDPTKGTQSIARKCQVKLLLMQRYLENGRENPGIDLIQQYGTSLTGSTRTDLQSTLDIFRDWSQKAKTQRLRLEIKVCLLVMFSFRFTDSNRDEGKMLVTPLLHGVASTNHPCFELIRKEDAGSFSLLVNQFKLMWAEATAIEKYFESMPADEGQG